MLSLGTPRLCSRRSCGSGAEDVVEALPDVSKELLGPLKFPQGSTAGCPPCRAGAGAPHRLIWSLDSRLGRLFPASHLLLVFPWEQQPPLRHLPQPPAVSPRHRTHHGGPAPSRLSPISSRVSPWTIPCMRLRCSGWQSTSFLAPNNGGVGGSWRSRQPRSVLPQVLLTFSLPPNFSWT